jgi:hypothetical protein
MKAYDQLCRFFLRFRYPITLPEEVAGALGIDLPNFLTFEQFVERLTGPECCPTRLNRFMPREKAEEAFLHAHCKELFKQTSLFSFYFTEGYLEFILHFDEQGLLRRLYMHHKRFKEERGVEIRLQATPIEVPVAPVYHKACLK